MAKLTKEELIERKRLVDHYTRNGVTQREALAKWSRERIAHLNSLADLKAYRGSR